MVQVDTPDQIATDRENLSQQEQRLLEASLERGLEDTYVEGTEVLRKKIQEYFDEIEQAAEIARAQFDQPLGGLNPREGTFAVSRIFSGYFGYDSWENVGTLTSGATNDWIDDDTPDNLGSGSSGINEPLKVGEEAVHIILGFGTFHESPKTSAIQLRINDSPRTAIRTKYEFTRTDTQIKWLDRPKILPENALLAARLYADNGGEDFVYPVGISFIEHRASQEPDPANMTDDSQDTSDNIVAQG
jgi:hypothetical protein